MKSVCCKYLLCAVMAMMMGMEIQAQSNTVPAAQRHREDNARKMVVADPQRQDVKESKNTDAAHNIQLQDSVLVIGGQQKEDTILVQQDSVGMGMILLQPTDTLVNSSLTINTDRWIPDPKKALWMAIVIPGGGQIYNKKYWKLPIIYGGFLGCLYALSWNNTMYHDYARAFIDITDSNPETKSYENFLPINYDVSANAERLQTLFKKKKDYYRRYRDLSIFCTIGVYALSIIDAYVDAELSSFDISRDLSMKVRPSIIHDSATAMHNGNSYGVKCAFAF